LYGFFNNKREISKNGNRAFVEDGKITLILKHGSRIRILSRIQQQKREISNCLIVLFGSRMFHKSKNYLIKKLTVQK
jgi:hypothetical protein